MARVDDAGATTQTTYHVQLASQIAASSAAICASQFVAVAYARAQQNPPAFVHVVRVLGLAPVVGNRLGD